MESERYLSATSSRILETRKRNKMTQVQFYKKLYPSEDKSDDSIRKKMNTIENEKMKEVDFDLLFRLCKYFDVSLDYLFGLKTDYPNYKNKAVCKYTGLSPDAVQQLHFWNEYSQKDKPEFRQGMTEVEVREWQRETERITDSKWIMEIVDRLLGFKSDEEKKNGVANMTIFYDLYMLSIGAPEVVKGILEETARADIPYIDKIYQSVNIAADSLSYVDEMHESHPISIDKINRQIWKERLMKDVDDFIADISKIKQKESEN